MRGYRLAPAADQDIEAIALYTLEAWGEKQTELYLSSLAELFSKIAESPHLGRERKEIRSGIFSRNHQKHIIFYRVSGGWVDILRVLHHARDVEGGLRD
ncbi:MAG: type II toxin-antitoxin system RelE/ParE family toxin [Pseudomonadota bacterium]|nr:type II toxin-antitoxin system RelE/ParE family toxin [Pseudomonadota bacterium]